jgi:hypothetical protein
MCNHTLLPLHAHDVGVHAHDVGVHAHDVGVLGKYLLGDVHYMFAVRCFQRPVLDDLYKIKLAEEVSLCNVK